MANDVLINQGIGTTIHTRDIGSLVHEQSIVGGLYTVRKQVIPVISTSAYATGDCLGGLMTIATAARFTGASGRITSVTVLDNTQAQRAAMDLVFFDRSVTVAGDNNPFACSDADMVFCLGVIPIVAGDYNTAWPGTPLNSLATKTPSPAHPFVVSATSLFCQAVVRATPTYVAATDLTFSFTITQD